MVYVWESDDLERVDGGVREVGRYLLPTLCSLSPRSVALSVEVKIKAVQMCVLREIGKTGGSLAGVFSYHQQVHQTLHCVYI